MEAINQISFDLIDWLQNLSPALDTFMIILTFLGRFEFYMLFIPIVYYTINRSLGLRSLFLLVSVDASTSYLKMLFHQPRPYWLAEVDGLSTEPTYGVPSSHASTTIALWGYLVYWVNKTWMWVVSIVIILLVGLSRLYLGVHFLHDILAGWVLGGIVLIVFIKSEDRVRTWWSQKSFNAQIGLGFFISLALILVGMIVIWGISGSLDPAEWAEYSDTARSITNYFTLGGVLFGSITGAVFMLRYAPFKVQGTWWAKILRFVIGILGVAVLYFGLDVLFAMIAVDESILGYFLRYIRYASVAFWGLFLAPWLFVKLRLAQTE